MGDEKKSSQFTDEEAAVYDRQIRLWGVESQKRLRKAKVLLVGLGALGNEVCKNVVLSGVQHMTMMDHRALTADDMRNQFLAPQDSIGELRAEQSYERAKELNPMVDLKTDTGTISSKSDDFFTHFDVVCLIGCSQEEQIRVNRICRREKVKFFSADCFANYGYSFADLGQHSYTEEVKKVTIGHLDSTKENGEPPSKKAKEINDDDNENDIVEKVIEFVSFEDTISNSVFCGLKERQISKSSKSYFVLRVMLQFRQKHGRFPARSTQRDDWEDMLSLRNDVMESLGVDSELLPDSFVGLSLGSHYAVACVVGGVLSQEIIKCVSGSGRPHNNFFFYDGTSDGGTVENIRSR